MTGIDADLSPAAVAAIAAAPWCYPSAVVSATIRALAQRAGIREPAEPATVLWPRCADCLQFINPESHAGHYDWCPFFGYADVPVAAR